MSASVQLNGLGEPIATWYAFDSELTNRGDFGQIGGSDGIQYDEISDGNVVINEELADNIEASIGDVIEIHWVEVDIIEGLVRSEVNLTVQYIVLISILGIEIVGNLFFHQFISGSKHHKSGRHCHTLRHRSRGQWE